jgi:hypothetical protein
MSENRATPRIRTLKGARIVVNEGTSTFNCTVKNLSQKGARLKVGGQVGIPPVFRLKFDDGRDFQCQVAWRKDDEIGVEFS